MLCSSVYFKNINFIHWLSFIGGVMFKVYIVGDAIRVVRRFSLPNVDEGVSNNAGVFRFPRVSCAAASADDADLDPCVAGTLACPFFLSFEVNVILGIRKHY
jgi:inositol-1,3,4-trisphosphate 5/6-kinase/inositol-tetrakisphosphate 1-kinase